MDDLRDIFNNPYDSSVASLKGRVYRAGVLLTDLPVGDLYFAQVPPVGTKIKSIALTGVIDGSVESYLIFQPQTSSIGTITSTINGYNLDVTKEALAACPVKRVSGITGGVLFSNGFSQTPSATAQRASSALSEVKLRGTYDNTHPALFKFSILSAGTKLNVTWIWEEI